MTSQLSAGELLFGCRVPWNLPKTRKARNLSLNGSRHQVLLADLIRKERRHRGEDPYL